MNWSGDVVMSCREAHTSFEDSGCANALEPCFGHGTLVTATLVAPADDVEVGAVVVTTALAATSLSLIHI